MSPKRAPATNPFRYGALALDDAFTDRQAELRELTSDILNGQDVVIFAPRRYGKSSLLWRVAQALVAKRVLVAQVNLMTAPTKERFAEKLAKTIHEDIASPLFRARERLRIFADLRITPTVTVNPQDGSVSFGFTAGYSPEDLDATLERLLELPGQLAAERNRRVALVFDEFQEIVEIDPDLPKLMRSVFEQQPEVAHIYLGSKRHMLARIFNDENEPFWRSAKQMELGVIDPPLFEGYLSSRFEQTGRRIGLDVVRSLLASTGGHPYATQELAYFLWEETPAGAEADETRLETALANVLRAEHAHFDLVWDRASTVQRLVLQALAVERGRPLSSDYRRRHRLPGPSSVQRALEALTRDELVARTDGPYSIAEPFLADWLRGQA
ncbi:MAG TPA: ATP-binding protein [Gaiellaceae bacterium]